MSSHTTSKKFHINVADIIEIYVFTHQFCKTDLFVSCVLSILIKFFADAGNCEDYNSADLLSSIVSYYYYYYYYYYFVSTITHGIYNYMPETNHVSKAQCSNCSVVTIYGT